MSRLRTAAAMLVESGRALGVAEECWQTERWLMDVIAEPDVKPAAERLVELLQRVSARRAVGDGHAARARTAAEELMAELEHPGARLARRLLRAARAARGAWRAGA